MPDPRSYLAWSLDGAVGVSPPAEIDITNADQLRAALLSALSASRKRPAVVVDMSQTVFCDSAGLQVLVRAHNRALADRGELRLVVSTAPVLHILALTGLDRVLRIFATVPDALAAGPVPAAAAEQPQTAIDWPGPPGLRRSAAG